MYTNIYNNMTKGRTNQQSATARGKQKKDITKKTRGVMTNEHTQKTYRTNANNPMDSLQA